MEDEKMKYYIDTIEQVTTDTDGEYNEYGGRTKYADYTSARTAYYTKLTNVSNSSAHVFMDIRIVDSNGGVVKKDYIGTYVDTDE